MIQLESRNGSDKERSVFDYLLYALAAGVLVTFSFSFLLWLRF